MNIDQLKEIIEYSPAVRMVRAKNAPLIASFLFLAFKQENKFSPPLKNRSFPNLRLNPPQATPRLPI
jgi:hypothetical protein